MIDNTLRTGKIKMYFVISFVIFAATIGYALIESRDDTTTFILLAFISGLSLIVYITLHLLKLHYFYLNRDKKNVTVRFYNSHPLLRKYKQFQIPLHAFSGYEVKKSLFDKKQELILKVKTKNGIVDYPPVSISALNKKEKRELFAVLNKL